MVRHWLSSLLNCKRGHLFYFAFKSCLPLCLFVCFFKLHLSHLWVGTMSAKTVSTEHLTGWSRWPGARTYIINNFSDYRFISPGKSAKTLSRRERRKKLWCWYVRDFLPFLPPLSLSFMYSIVQRGNLFGIGIVGSWEQRHSLRERSCGNRLFQRWNLALVCTRWKLNLD